MNDGPAGRWRGSLPRAFVVTVAQDFSNGCGLGDEGDDLVGSKYSNDNQLSKFGETSGPVDSGETSGPVDSAVSAG